MATSTVHFRQNDNRLLYALALSVLIHTIAALKLPNLEFDQPPIPETLVVEIAQPKQAEPSPVSEPEPTPEPVQPKPKIKPEPKPVKQLPAPSPIAEPPSRQESVAPPSPPAVITAAPKAETTPAFTAPPPPPEPPKPQGPSQQDIDAALSLYGNMLTNELAKHKQYPRVAQMRGWQGEPVLELQLDSSGNLVSSKISKSSGFEILDKQALEMAKKATFPVPPNVLRGRSFTILVPVSFLLE